MVYEMGTVVYLIWSAFLSCKFKKFVQEILPCTTPVLCHFYDNINQQSMAGMIDQGEFTYRKKNFKIPLNLWFCIEHPFYRKEADFE